MGLFNFFSHRRRRESAIPGGTPESVTRQLKGDGKPIGQPVGQAFPQAGQPAVNLTGSVDMVGVLAMMQQAFQTGNVQIAQGENQVIDMRGSGLREQILGAMQQHGIDPETVDGSQVNAGDVPGLQEQIMQALENAGVDVSQFGDAGTGAIGIEGGDAGGFGSDAGSSGGDSSSSSGDSGSSGGDSGSSGSGGGE